MAQTASVPGVLDTGTVNLSTGSVSFPLTLASLPGRNGLDFNLSIQYSSMGIREIVDTWTVETPTGVIGLGWSFPQEKIVRIWNGSTQECTYGLLAENTLYALVRGGADAAGEIYEATSYQFWKIRYQPERELWAITREDGTCYFYGGNVRQTNGQTHTSTGDSIEWGVRWGTWTGPSNVAEKQEQFPIAWNLTSIENIWGDRVTFLYEQDQQLVGRAGATRKQYTQACRLSQVIGASGESILLHYGPEEDAENPYETRVKQHTPPGGGPDAYQDRLERHFLDSLEVLNANGVLLSHVQLRYASLGSGEMRKQILKSMVCSNSHGHPYEPPRLFAYYGETSADGVSVSKTDASNVARGGALFGALKSMTAPQGATTSYQYTELAIPNACRDLDIPRPGHEWHHPLTYLGPDYAVVIWRGTGTKERQIHVSAYQWVGRWVATSLDELTVNDAADAKNFQVAIASTFFAIITPEQAQTVHLFRKRPYSHGGWRSYSRKIGSLTTCLMASGDNFFAILDQLNGKLSCFIYNEHNNVNNWQDAPGFDEPLKTGKKTIFALTAGNNYICAVSAAPDLAFQPEIRLYSRDALGQWHSPLLYSSEHFVARKEHFRDLDTLSLEGGPTFVSLLFSGHVNVTLMGHQLFVLRWTEKAIQAERLPVSVPDVESVGVQSAVAGDMIVLTTQGDGLGEELGGVKIVYQYNGERWLSREWKNDSERNNYLGTDSFSTTQHGQSQYWEFNPNNGQWDTGQIPPYKDGNPTLWEKLWSTVWPIFSLAVGILTLPLSFEAGLLIDLALLPFDLYSLLISPGTGGGGHDNERFFTGDNRVYYRDTTGTWRQIGELLSEAEKAEKPVPGEDTTFETQELQFQNTQAASTFIAYAITRDRKKILKGGSSVRPAGYPKYISKIQLLKNGAFLSAAATLPEHEALQRSPDDETSLVGWNAFLTFQGGKTLREATSLKLHRVIQDGFQGPLKDYVVSRVSVHDGYVETHLHYDYETASAECSPAGTSALYNRVMTMYSGSSATPMRSNGYTESYFYVGDTASLPHQPADPTSTNSADYPALVAGHLYATRVFDSAGHQVAATTLSWLVYQRSLLGWGAGCFLRQTREEQERDGSRKVVENDYGVRGYDGFPGITRTSSYDVTGSREAISVWYSYACDLFPQLKERHILAPIAQTSTHVNDITTAFQATTWLPTQGTPFRLTPGEDLPSSFQGSGWIATGKNSISTSASSPLTSATEETTAMLPLPPLTLTPTFSGKLLFTYHCAAIETEDLLRATLEVWVDNAKVWDNKGDSSGNGAIDLRRSYQRVEWRWECAVRTPADGNTSVTASISDISLQCLAPAATYQAKKPVDFQANPEKAPLDWLKTSEVVARHPIYGLVTETRDVDSIITSTIYDTNYQFPVARFVHASAENHEAGYYGFEDYEERERWQVTETSDGDLSSHTGQKALSGRHVRIEPLAFTPRTAATPYIVSAWMKPRREGNGGQIGFGSMVKQIAPHDDDWQYVEFVTTTPQAGQKPFASCDGTIDDFRFGPVDASFSATVYDPIYHFVTAQLGTNGETTRLLYDDLHILIAMTGPDGQDISYLMTETHSRDGGKPFDAARPNQKLSLLPGNGGRYYPTLSGYLPRQAMGRSGMSGVVFTGQSAPSPTTNYGLKFRVSTTRTTRNQTAFSMTFGDRSVSCDADPTTLKLVPKGSRDTVLKSFTPGYDPLDGAEWMLIVLGQQALFFLDGDFLFCEKLSENPTVLTFGWTAATPGDLSTNDAFVFFDPIIELQYTDGLDRVIQTVDLDQHAGGTVARQILYDGWGHPAITTRPLHIPEISLTYQRELVKTFDWNTGKMTGKVVDYYTQASVQAPGQKADDAFYPYSRQVAEANPLARISEIGGPGVDFKAGSHQSVLMDFGRTAEANVLLADLNLAEKAGYYTLLTTRRPFDGHTRVATTQLFDLQGRLVALRQGTGQTALTSTRHAAYTSDGTIKVMAAQPNFYTHPEGQADQQYTSATNSDFLGHVQVSHDSDTNTEQRIYDPAGRLCFKLDAEGANQHPHRILYWRYDDSGRILEEGTLRQQWDREQLQHYADTQARENKASVLPAMSTYTWKRQYVYDLTPDGETTHLKGRLYEVRTRDEDGQEVCEAFTYNLAGRLVSTQLVAEAFDPQARVTSYEYNKIGQVTRISYPQNRSEQSSFEVRYFYNSSGQLASIGTADDPSRYAVYEYDLEGRVKTEHLNKQRLHYNHSYDFQGHLLALQESSGLFSEELSYRDASGTFRDGNIVSATFTGSALSSPHEYTYQYDEAGRLTAAITGKAKAGMIPHPEWNLQQVAYDANGNLLHMQQGDTSSTYQYTQGTNKLKALLRKATGQHPSGSEASDEAYEHNANGWITKSGGIDAVNYDPNAALPVDVHAGKQRTHVRYGGRRQRVVKTTTTSGQNASQEQRLYVHGANTYPLVEHTQTGKIYYIYGPGGLIAQSEDAQTFAFFLKDHLGSTRVVVNEANQPVATFNYLPFGSLVPENSHPQEAVRRFRYLFTGQEYDEEIGLHNYRARMYGSDLGRFLTPDPKQQFPSPYVYVNNNPLNFTDPSGEMLLSRLRMTGRLLRTGRIRRFATKTLRSFRTIGDLQSFESWKVLGPAHGMERKYMGLTAELVNDSEGGYEEVLNLSHINDHMNGNRQLFGNGRSLTSDFKTALRNASHAVYIYDVPQTNNPLFRAITNEITQNVQGETTVYHIPSEYHVATIEGEVLEHYKKIQADADKAWLRKLYNSIG